MVGMEGAGARGATHPRAGLAEGKSFLATRSEHDAFSCCPDPHSKQRPLSAQDP